MKRAVTVKKSPQKQPSPKVPTPRPKSYYPINTKGLCILCFRERRPVISRPVGNNSRQKFSSQFCTLLFRHLKLDIQRHIIQSAGPFPNLKKYKKVGVVLCEDCSLLARSFCELYCQMEQIQMKLNACSKDISEIVRIAGRIPSRVQAYEERIRLEKNQEIITALAKNIREEVVIKSIKSLFYYILIDLKSLSKF